MKKNNKKCNPIKFGPVLSAFIRNNNSCKLMLIYYYKLANHYWATASFI